METKDIREGRVSGQEITVRSTLGDVTFTGELLAANVHDGRWRKRWTDMSLWAVESASCKYLLQTVGRSVIYHRVDSPCGAGMEMPMSKIEKDERWADFEPCAEKDCRPPALEDRVALPDDACVLVEEDRYRTYECADADALIASLRRPGSPYDAARPVENVSFIGLRLLKDAARHDDDIARAIWTTRRL